MKSIKDIDVEGKKVFLRVDYNVPTDEQLNITDDNRIKATLDLIRYLVEKKAKIIIASHMGRPDGKPDARFSLEKVGDRLAELLNQPVEFVKDCVGDTVRTRVDKLADGQILLLENLRFYPAEKKNEDWFSEQLAGLCDIYVNNAFAVSHRDQASVTGVPRFVREKAAGFLLEKEVRSYSDSVENPKRPLAAVIGGAKVSGKLEALENMLNFVDCLIIGGAMANTFLKSQGVDTQGSMVETDLIQTAAGIVQTASEKGIDLLLPQDLVCADAFKPDARTRMVSVNDIPGQWMALDIGEKTVQTYASVIKKAKTIVWNGPMGVFEMDAFMSGTKGVADAIAESDAFSIVGGGDTGLAAKKCNVTEKISYISTGGGAFLHLMEGKKLPGVAALE